MICEKVEKSDIPTIDKKKYLVPAVSSSRGARVCSRVARATKVSRANPRRTSLSASSSTSFGELQRPLSDAHGQPANTPNSKRIKLSPEKAIFIFVDDILPPTAALMSAIYEEHK